MLSHRLFDPVTIRHVSPTHQRVWAPTFFLTNLADVKYTPCQTYICNKQSVISFRPEVQMAFSSGWDSRLFRRRPPQWCRPLKKFKFIASFMLIFILRSYQRKEFITRAKQRFFAPEELNCVWGGGGCKYSAFIGCGVVYSGQKRKKTERLFKYRGSYQIQRHICSGSR